uniref:Cryptochrome/DNA photolyase FAD-binding domain-containing protein n=1 Tax=Lotharella oceanica TaxID=641309 RepID=A0A7S2TLW3_9EUKA
MRALLKGGWINFRMRAMLVSVASYMLWLDWRPTSRFLAQHFLDYEPGIHYPQFQMQAGTTGINALRVYNPTKQIRDHDKEGKFIKRYVPELANVPTKYIAEPWKMPEKVQQSSGCIIGKDYPGPIVDLKEMYKESRARIGAVRKQLKSKEEAKKVYEKHGSRMRPRARGSKRKISSSSEDGSMKQKSLNEFMGKKPRPGA